MMGDCQVRFCERLEGGVPWVYSTIDKVGHIDVMRFVYI